MKIWSHSPQRYMNPSLKISKYQCAQTDVLPASEPQSKVLLITNATSAGHNALLPHGRDKDWVLDSTKGANERGPSQILVPESLR